MESSEICGVHFYCNRNIDPKSNFLFHAIDVLRTIDNLILFDSLSFTNKTHRGYLIIILGSCCCFKKFRVLNPKEMISTSDCKRNGKHFRLQLKFFFANALTNRINLAFQNTFGKNGDLFQWTDQKFVYLWIYIQQLKNLTLIKEGWKLLWIWRSRIRILLETIIKQENNDEWWITHNT